MNAQASLEFLIYVGVLVIILSIFLWSNVSFQRKYTNIRIVDEAKKLCDNIAFEINSAVRAGEGYSRKFYVERDFSGISNFDIIVENYTVMINWSEGVVSSSIITKNVSGSVQKGWNLIQNVNGDVYVSPL
jgi:hypothetical protein